MDKLSTSRERFLDHIQNMVEYWDSLPNETTRSKLEGLAFSICVTLDGGSMDCSTYELIDTESGVDIAGELHENLSFK